METKEKERKTSETINSNKNDTQYNTPLVQDKYNLVYIFVFLMGMVHFIPWSFFTTSTGYWMYKFRNTALDNTTSTSKDRTTLQSIFSASINTALAVSAFIFFIVTVLFGHYIKLKKRLFIILILMLISFSILAAFVMIDTDSYQEAFLSITLIIVVLVNAINAFLSVSMYTVISQLPSENSKYLAIYLITLPLSKIFTSLVEIGSHLLGLGTVDSAFVYFLIGVFVIFLSGCWAFYIINYNEFYLTHLKDFKESRSNSLNLKDFKNLTKKLWTNLVALGFMTLLGEIVPNSLIVSEFEKQGRWPDVFFVPTICFLMTSIVDWLGRLCTIKLPPLKVGQYQFMAISFAALVILYPLCFFCNAQPRPHGTPVIFKHDYQCIIILMCYSFFKGYILNLTSLNIPKLVTSEELKLGYHSYLIISGGIVAASSPLGLLSVSLL